jgi:flagellar basal-body rod modification protein FlgD
MPTGIIGGLTNSAAASQKTARNGFADISSEQFVKILITELTNQDPLAPNDTQQVLEQLSSLRNIESQMQLQKQLEALVTQNGVAQAGALIGKLVEGLDGSNSSVQGLVTSIRVVNGKAVLELDSGKQLPMDRVTRIMNQSGGGQVQQSPPPLVA